MLSGQKKCKMEYSKEEIIEAYRKVKADIEHGEKTQRQIEISMELQYLCFKHLKNMMTEEEIKSEEEPEEELELDEEEATKE